MYNYNVSATIRNQCIRLCLGPTGVIHIEHAYRDGDVYDILHDFVRQPVFMD